MRLLPLIFTFAAAPVAAQTVVPTLFVMSAAHTVTNGKTVGCGLGFFALDVFGDPVPARFGVIHGSINFYIDGPSAIKLGLFSGSKETIRKGVGALEKSYRKPMWAQAGESPFVTPVGGVHRAVDGDGFWLFAADNSAVTSLVVGILKDGALRVAFAPQTGAIYTVHSGLAIMESPDVTEFKRCTADLMREMQKQPGATSK